MFGWIYLAFYFGWGRCVDCGFLALDTFSVGASVDIRFVARVVAFSLYVALSDHTHHYSMFCFLWGLGYNLIASIKHLACAHFPHLKLH
jgi:hypothetical protein